MRTTVMADAFSAIGIFVLVLVGSTSAVLLLLKCTNAYFDRREDKRRGLLKGYVFPASCYSEVQQRYPHLTAEQVAIAFEQLRLYFEVCLVYLSPDSSKLAAMPSKLVDRCWHAFICETREYQRFCKSVFGSFLHHESSVNKSFPLVYISADGIHNGKTSKSATEVQQEIDFKNQLSAARIYRWSLAICGEKSNSEVVQIPLLFSIDREFNIKDGYFYSPDVLEFLAKFDLKAAEAVVTKRETEAAGGSAAACGDGGSCGGCGGSV
jgi:hypothetical protein